MAITTILASFLLLLPFTVTADFLSPLLSPIFDNVCKEVNCGKGICKPSGNTTFKFECECSPGWKQARPDNSDSFKFLPCLIPNYKVCKEVECGKGSCKPSENTTFNFECECSPGWKQARSDHSDSLKFLPCVIPNCTLDYSCTEAPPPVQDKERQSNDSSIFDPCYWSNCGGGTCNKTSPFTHKCECNDGYYNLLNVTAFPCFRDCSIGMDCKSFGIPFMNRSSHSATPGVSENTSNQASSMLRANSNWGIIWFILLGVASISWEVFAH